MARRNKNKPVDDFIEVVSFLPPWACLVMAAAGYFLLHAYATQPISAVTAPSQTSGIAIEAILKGLATAGQYILPLLCGAAAVLSWSRRRRSISESTKSLVIPFGAVSATAGTPSCPLCSSTMARRVAKHGSNAGNAFWGCSNYPRCRGTRAAD